MEKQIQIFYHPNAVRFLKELDAKTMKRFQIIFDKVMLGIRDGEIFKKLKGTDLWEFRLDDYRILAFWDGEGDEVTLVVCTHGFQKKRDGIPKKEISKAEAIRKEYFGK